MSRDDPITKTVEYFLKRYRRATISEAAEVAAQRERESLLTGCEEFCKIPVDIIKIAERRGLALGEHLDDAVGRDGATFARNAGLVVKTAVDKAVKNNRFTIAHEIGHDLFRQGTRHEVSILSRKEREAEERICEKFAAALLMPPGHFRHLMGRVSGEEPWDILMGLEDVARRFGVSLPALISRAGHVRSPTDLSCVLLYLAYFPNRRTGMDPRLRVRICCPLDTMGNVRTWYNRSARGLNFRSAETLFASWANMLGSEPEATGGRYVLDASNTLTRAKAETLLWVAEEMPFSVKTNGKWKEETLPVRAASCLYARRGWREHAAYVVCVIKRPD